MREKVRYILLLLVVLLIGVVIGLSDQNHTTNPITSKSVNIKENDTINTAINKIYDAVVVIQGYDNSKPKSAGSGFVYKKDKKYGYIMTNHHVIEGASEIKVTTIDGITVPGTLLGSDSEIDIAVVRVDISAVLAVASIGDSTKSKVGDTVFTVGTPIDSEYIGTVTKGILSSSTRVITVSTNKGEYMMEALQTDASINPGNSGGPLVNINGEVIGINSLKLVTEAVEGMGFAIPIEVAMAYINKLENGEEIKRPYIGVSMYDINNESLLKQNKVQLAENITHGAVIASIESGSAAEASGLLVNDVILEIAGTPVRGTAHFKYILYKHNINDTVKLKINRDGKDMEISLKLTKAVGE